MPKGLFIYKDNFYTTVGHCKSKNAITRRWEKHVLYKNLDGSDFFSREVNDFKKKFEPIEDIKNSIIIRKRN